MMPYAKAADHLKLVKWTLSNLIAQNLLLEAEGEVQ